MNKNFTATRTGITVNSTSASATAPLSTIAVASGSATDALLDNRGSAPCYFLFGGPDVTVDKNSGVRLAADERLVFGKGNATHVAVISDVPTTVTVHVGEGS